MQRKCINYNEIYKALKFLSFKILIIWCDQFADIFFLGPLQGLRAAAKEHYTVGD